MLDTNTVCNYTSREVSHCSEEIDVDDIQELKNISERIRRKSIGEARRQVERLQEDIRLKAIIDGERWF